MTQLSEIYNNRILELAANIGGVERLADADATATAHSKLCGSTVTVDLRMDGEVVAAFGQTVKACLLGQAAASVMARNIVGTRAEELREVGGAMRRMLKTIADMENQLERMTLNKPNRAKWQTEPADSEARQLDLSAL